MSVPSYIKQFIVEEVARQTTGNPCYSPVNSCGCTPSIPVEVRPGDAGLSAYQIAVQEGFIGTEDQWLESLGQNQIIQNASALASLYNSSRTQIILQNGMVYDRMLSSLPIDNYSVVAVSGSTSERWVIRRQLWAKDFGAKGDGQTDDTIALRRLFAAAKNLRKATVNFDPIGNYRVTGEILYDLRQAGRISNNDYSLTVNGHHATIFLDGDSDGFYGLSLLYDDQPEQDSGLTVRDLWFQTDNVNRPNGLRVEYANFMHIENVRSYQAWNGFLFDHCASSEVNNCQAYGNILGFDLEMCRDTKLDNCLAFNCSKGFFSEGGNDGGVAGGNTFIHVHGVGCGINIHLSRMQTMKMTHIVSDVPTNTGILIESCNYLKAAHWQLGPNSSGTTAWKVTRSAIPGSSNNDYNEFDDIFCENEVTLEYMNFSRVRDLTATHGGNALSTALVDIKSCYEVTFDSLKARDIQVAKSVRVRPDSNRIVFNGGEVDKAIWFESSSAQRTGGHVLNGTVCAQDCIFDSGTTTLPEYGFYYYQGRKTTIEEGQRFPRTVASFTFSGSGQVGNFDVNTIIPDPMPEEQSVIAEFVATAGVIGSYTAATIQVIRSSDFMQLLVVNNIGTKGGVDISIPDNQTIRFKSVTATPSHARLTLTSYKFL